MTYQNNKVPCTLPTRSQEHLEWGRSIVLYVNGHACIAVLYLRLYENL